MGRRKIEIEFIREDRSRATTFIKRKSGLFKKAHELAILTGAQVAVVVFSQQDRLFTYSNVPCSGICTKYLRTPDAYETKGPHDYSATHDNDEETDEEQAAGTPARKGSHPGHARTDSNATATFGTSPKVSSRRNSAQASPSIVNTKLDDPESTRQSPQLMHASKRSSPPTLEQIAESPKFLKREHMPELSDVRSSPHHGPRPRNGSHTAATPARSTSDFSHMSAPMVPPPQQSYQMPTAHASAIFIQQQQQQQQNTAAAQMIQQQQENQAQEARQHGAAPNRRPKYAGLQYEPSRVNTRQLPMAPPLNIPTSMPIEQLSHSQQIEAQREGQTLLPVGAANSGPLRVLLPGDGGDGATGLTPTDTPSGFASHLYSPSNMSGIGTNISIPRISTDVGSLFYNWNTNEPGLSPATSMALGQFKDNDVPNSQQQGSNRSQLSGPPISAGVLENFSPTTAQWLSGHNVPPPHANLGKPY